MALFGKLFEKKICSICGGEIGLLGNRKLSDGNCCKKCAGALSPWFEDRRESTVEQIKQQLEYRTRNAEALKTFRVTEIIGEYQKMYVEAENGVPTRFFVTSASNYLEENPDIIFFEDVLSCTVDIDENEEEIMRENQEGENVSYNPPRFRYHYNFYIDMVIGNTPWFDEIRFNINDEDVTLENVKGILNRSMVARAGSSMMRSMSETREEKRYQEYEQMCQKICRMVEDARNGVQTQKAASIAEEAAIPAFCSACGAPNDGSKFCQFCGTKLV